MIISNDPDTKQRILSNADTTLRNLSALPTHEALAVITVATTALLYGLAKRHPALVANDGLGFLNNLGFSLIPHPDPAQRDTDFMQLCRNARNYYTHGNRHAH